MPPADTGAGSLAQRLAALLERLDIVPLTLPRFGLACVCLGTSLYCLLASKPVTYYWFIRDPILFGLPEAVRVQPVLFLLMLLAVAPSLSGELRRPDAGQRLARGFLLFHLAAGIFLALAAPLADPPNDFRSYLWALVALFPLVWLALLDHAGCNEKLSRAELASGNDLRLAIPMGAALFLSLAYAAAAYWRRAGSSDGLVWLGAGASVTSHLFLFLLLAVLLTLGRDLARRFRRPASAEYFLAGLVLWFCLGVVVRIAVLAPIGFNDHWADVYAGAFAMAVVAFLGGLGLRLTAAGQRRAVRPAAGVLGVLLLPLVPSRRVWWVYAAWLAGLLGIAYGVPALLRTFDWNFVAQRLSVVVVWAGSFVLSYSLWVGSAKKRASRLTVLLLAAGSLAGYLALAWGGEPQARRAALEEYSGYDISFQVAHDLLQPAVRESEYREFYGFLRQNANLPKSTPLELPELELVERFEPVAGPKPHIFLIVIDSLRRDYLSVHNPAVDFTPAIERFARESIVFEKAFTRYGGTALAEPSIWSGAMQPHLIYPEGYYRLNTLGKLIEREGYRSYVTLDPHLRMILRASPGVNQLDEGLRWEDYDLCRTVAELQQRLDARRDDLRPVFVYTQPQNLHTVSLFRHRGERRPARGYPGFNEAYAGELERVDACFGGFVEYLKARRLYDDSIIVLTADHGDSLGEFGRVGHTNKLFPEVLRVPLIVRVPERLRKGLRWDATEVAFTMDVAPTLYYLLGHRRLRQGPVLGRPLVAQTDEERRSYLHANYLVASSYGPVFGLLDAEGHSLFIVDAASEATQFYDLTRSDLLPAMFTAAQRDEVERAIRGHLAALNDFYGVKPAGSDSWGAPAEEEWTRSTKKDWLHGESRGRLTAFTSPFGWRGSVTAGAPQF